MLSATGHSTQEADVRGADEMTKPPSCPLNHSAPLTVEATRYVAIPPYHSIQADIKPPSRPPRPCTPLRVLYRDASHCSAGKTACQAPNLYALSTCTRPQAAAPLSRAQAWGGRDGWARREEQKYKEIATSLSTPQNASACGVYDEPKESARGASE